MQLLRKLAPNALSLFMAVIFLDSLRYKFTNHPKTQEIFGRLDAWAGSLGAPGLFAQTGLFSQYVIGGAELAAGSLQFFAQGMTAGRGFMAFAAVIFGAAASIVWQRATRSAEYGDMTSSLEIVLWPFHRMVAVMLVVTALAHLWLAWRALREEPA